MMRVFVVGHRGMVGRALVDKLWSMDGFEPVHPQRRIDFRDPAATDHAMNWLDPDAVVVCAGKVGGIESNIREPADFTYRNALIQTNVIKAARWCRVKKLITLGSSCIYPRLCKQPMSEEDFLTGPYEPTNRGYAVAKTLGIELCRAFHKQDECNFYALMPPNLYGPHDNFKPDESHAVAALLRRVMEIPNYHDYVVWGSGNPCREFMHVNDLASAIGHCLQHVNASDCGDNGFLNSGTGESCSILKLAQTVIEASGKYVNIVHDRSKPDGMPNKLMDSSKLNALGWNHSIQLKDGIQSTYDWLAENWGMSVLRL